MYITYILNAFFKNRKKDKGSLNNILITAYEIHEYKV